MSIWNYIVLGLCLVLLGGLLWAEWRRANRARLFWRCAATMVAVAALLCLGLPFYYWREVVRPSMLLTEAAKGVVEIDWQRMLNRGERLQVQGSWAGRPAKLLLMGMGEVVDSTKAGAGGRFSLGVVPAQVGRAVYRLVGVVGKDTVEREELPVEVATGGALRVLLLAASPDFENRFLVKWLSGDGHVIASRTMVSRGKAAEAFVNRDRLALAPLTPALLGNFDLVVADAAALPARGTVERSVLQREIAERGLGLVVKVDSMGLDSMVRVMGGRISRVLDRDPAGKIVAGAFFEGSGKVVFTALDTSYSRLLAGDHVGYARYWSELLREGRRKVGAKRGGGAGRPRVGEETVVELPTADDWPQGIAGERAVYLAQDARLSFLWRGKYWPERAGWQAISRPMGDTVWWYVWPAVRNAATGEHVGREQVEFPKIWFWGLFLLGAVFLWVERKMGGMSG